MPDTPASSRSLTPVEFGGSAGEYFRIWIVNIALTIVTLGIYSAWATVRTRRYFYTRTSIRDSNFDFHASPKAILIGRAIAVAALALYFFSAYLHPFAPFAVILLVLAAVPWLVVRSRIFRLRNSSYRGIRFDFRPDYGGAFRAYYGGALLSIITLGLAAPTALYWRNRFAIDNSAFGKTRFEFHGEAGPFYSIVWKSIGLGILGFFAYSALLVALGPLGQDVASIASGSYSPASELYTVAASLLLVLVYLGIGVYVQVRLRNYTWSNTTLGDNAFLSTLSATTMFWLYLTNIVAIVCTLGLMVPWAKVRLARYRAGQTAIMLADDWERYAAADQQPGSALGDELGEAFDVGVDIGI